MNIIACLGNPEKVYAKTRHNIGFIIGEYLAQDFNISVNQKSFSSHIGSGKFSGFDILMLFPQTYMNNSGVAVQQAMNYYKVKPTNLIVIHDEIELPFGQFRLKFGGGHKGHNGIRSIAQHIGTADFHRVRFGVGRPSNPNIEVSDYVLSNFLKEELVEIEHLFHDIWDSIISLLE